MSGKVYCLSMCKERGAAVIWSIHVVVVVVAGKAAKKTTASILHACAHFEFGFPS